MTGRTCWRYMRGNVAGLRRDAGEDARMPDQAKQEAAPWEP